MIGSDSPDGLANVKQSACQEVIKDKRVLFTKEALDVKIKKVSPLSLLNLSHTFFTLTRRGHLGIANENICFC